MKSHTWATRLSALLGIAALMWLPGPCASAQESFVTSPRARIARPDATTYTETVLANFTGSAAPNYGAAPENGLIQASDGNFYGTTVAGPTEHSGVFRVTPSGVYTQIYTFADYSVDFPSTLVQGSDGNLYGTTVYGGTDDFGVIFRVTLNGTGTILYSFSSGAYPSSASLIQAEDGNIYGASGNAVYKFSPSNPSLVTVIHTFYGGTTDGSEPEALVEGSDGNLYGTTFSGDSDGCQNGGGGIEGCGTVFKLSLDGSSYEILHSFAPSGLEGTGPSTGLIASSDGNLYGTTWNAGQYCPAIQDSCGTLFKISPDGSGFQVLHAFGDGATDGVWPQGAIVLGSDGLIYGTTTDGGDGGYGSVFTISNGGSTYSVVYSEYDMSLDGFDIFGGLVQGSDGSFYANTPLGGTEDLGVVFKLAPSPGLLSPVQLSVPSSVEAGSSFTLDYIVANAYSKTMQLCFATNTAGDETGWIGVKNGSTTATEATLTASSTPGTYTYTLTCGGRETGIVTLTVVPSGTADLTFTSVTHNLGSVQVGSSTSGTSNYGVKVTNTSDSAISATGISLTGSNEFKYQTNCPARLASGAYCEVLFTFAPTSTGTVTANWSIAGLPDGTTFNPSNGGTLTGTGVPANGLNLTTSVHNFGNVTVGSSSPVYGTVLTNSYSFPVTLTYTTSGSTASFPLVTNCGAVLYAGESCNSNFTFTPKATGFVTETIGVAASYNGNPIAVTSLGQTVTGFTLKGTGQ